MKRNILLIEPDYKNKYPPIGLMKIAAYHRMLDDNVVFYKGDMKDFVIEQIYEECIEKLHELAENVKWRKRKESLKKYIKTKHSNLLRDDILKGVRKDKALITEWLKHFSDYYKKGKYVDEPKWDRIYVTTLFTFHWKVTIKTIEFSKLLVKDINQLKVGGVLASLLPNEVKKATGIKPVEGLLDKAGILDDNDIIIDDLPLDYSILDEIDYEYPTGSAYFTFMTKGCKRTCAFCSVPKLEPDYKEKIPTKKKFKETNKRFGEQRNLLLMDNNVLASPKFPQIIKEIKAMGFYKGATYVEPNQLKIAIKNLRAGNNDRATVNRCYKILQHFLDKRAKGKTAQEFYDVLEKYGLLDIETTTKENLLKVYPKISKTYERLRDKSPKQRFVDFNQGTDARYVTDEYMKLMSEIPIYPLRIAFDYIGMKKQYVNAVKLAAKYGINRLSNYLLFNFVDKPQDLYNRMELNVTLSNDLGVHIYSFPMKYIPLLGEDAKRRDYLGKHWNKKFIRAIQSVCNVTKGIVAPGRSFFEKAFGRDEDEYFEILYMPETYIIYRKVFEDLGYTQKWKSIYRTIRKDEKEWQETKEIIEKNDFKNIEKKTKNPKIRYLLQHYLITRDDVKSDDKHLNKLKAKFEKLLKDDPFLNLTTPYEYETDYSQPKKLIEKVNDKKAPKVKGVEMEKSGELVK